MKKHAVMILISPSSGIIISTASLNGPLAMVYALTVHSYV